MPGYEHKMSKEYLEFGDADVEKWKFHSSKNPMTKDDVVIGKILISIKFACEKRALIVLSDSKFKNWLCLYLTDFCRWLDLRKILIMQRACFFLVKDEELLQRITGKMLAIWWKKDLVVSQCIKANTWRLKKIYCNKVNTNFHGIKIHKEGSPCLCLSIIVNELVFKTTDR